MCIVHIENLYLIIIQIIIIEGTLKNPQISLELHSLLSTDDRLHTTQVG